MDYVVIGLLALVLGYFLAMYTTYTRDIRALQDELDKGEMHRLADEHKLANGEIDWSEHYPTFEEGTDRAA